MTRAQFHVAIGAVALVFLVLAVAEQIWFGFIAPSDEPQTGSTEWLMPILTASMSCTLLSSVLGYREARKAERSD